MIPKTSLEARMLIVGSIMVLGLTSAHAAARYWDNPSDGAASTKANWSDSPTGGAPRNVPGQGDDAIFSSSNAAANNLTITFTGSGTANNTQFLDLQFNNTGSTTLEGVDGAGHLLSLGGGTDTVPGGSLTIITVNAGAGPVTIGDTANALNLRDQISTPGSVFTILNNSANALTIQNGVTVRLNDVGTGTYEIGGTGSTVFNGVLSDQNNNKQLALSVDSGSSATLNNANTFTGSTTINGTLHANAAGALGGSGAVAINSGGSLVFGASGAMNSAGTVTMSGGSMVLGGTNQTIGTLTLSSGVNTIDLTGGGLLTISNIGSWVTGATLDIVGWIGNSTTGDSTHQLVLGADALAFFQDNPQFLDDITWTDTSADNGVSFGSFSSAQLSGSQLTPSVTAAPEPSTIFAGLALLALLTWGGRQQLMLAGRRLVAIRR